MRKGFLALMAAVLLLVGAAADASNMGFKLTQPVTASVTKFTSLPFFNAYTDAASLRTDVIAAGGTAVEVFNFNETSQAFERYAGGGFGQVNFAITPGIGYQVRSATAISWVIVGSHNPALIIPITASITKFASVPYHTTNTDAAGLRTEIQTAGGTAVEVFNFNETTQAFERYAGGGFGQVNFVLTPGKLYQIRSATSLSWTPNHY